MKSYYSLATVLVVIGAVNWGLIGLLDYNLVGGILGMGSVLEKVVYVLVGLSGMMVAYQMWGMPKKR